MESLTIKQMIKKIFGFDMRSHFCDFNGNSNLSLSWGIIA